MRARFGFLDPGMIMAVVVSLIILAVGVFAFFITLNQLTNVVTDNATQDAVRNVQSTGNNVFNIVGIVLIIGAILTIVGMVYSYTNSGY